MVTIINYKQRQKEDGSMLYVLEVQGGIEMVMSQTTGQFLRYIQKKLQSHLHLMSLAKF